MTDRERLIEKIKLSEKQELLDFLTADLDEAIDMSGGTQFNGTVEHLADYLLEHGVIVLPCKVGDIVYVTYQDSQTIEEKRVKSMSHEIKEFENSMVFFCKHNYGFLDTDINRKVFLTREEAEKALKERK